VVVDDCTPADNADSMEVLARLRALSPRVTVLRTPTNRLKAGALNLGLAHLLAQKGPHTPAVVLTLDDDVVIGPSTVAALTQALLADPGLGAVCSRASVLNKNKNLLTRLQGLEYVGYNAIRLADQGFVRGPLVMHGMLTAFRTRALRQAGPFAEAHLIEDYEMTTRLKTLGWDVRAALDAHSWTEVPETLGAFWRQRTRWSLGGVQVVLATRDRSVIIQDVLGHGVFIATLVVLLFLLLAPGSGSFPPWVAIVIISLSCVQLISWYALQLWLMRWYKEKDAWDWLLRASLIPELLFSNIMTLVLLGSYAYVGFNALARRLSTGGRVGRGLVWVVNEGFRIAGYSGRWGTRS
jgi:cellulose synthase/poly-beta-1,6-N-acetylglucosamine synthase-like glycosyltransferase